jgi:hypothetical protein
MKIMTTSFQPIQSKSVYRFGSTEYVGRVTMLSSHPIADRPPARPSLMAQMILAEEYLRRTPAYSQVNPQVCADYFQVVHRLCHIFQPPRAFIFIREKIEFVNKFSHRFTPTQRAGLCDLAVFLAEDLKKPLLAKRYKKLALEIMKTKS